MRSNKTRSNQSLMKMATIREGYPFTTLGERQDRYEQAKDMLDKLSDGHMIYTESYARKVCDIFNVKHNPILVKKHRGDLGASFDECVGVCDLELLTYLAKELKVDISGDVFIGRGSSARYIAEQISKKFLEV